MRPHLIAGDRLKSLTNFRDIDNGGFYWLYTVFMTTTQTIFRGKRGAVAGPPSL